MGHFFHYNTEYEIACVFSANGALLRTGQVMANPKLHGVNTFLKDETDEESFLVLTITQRQSEGPPQDESVIFRCSKCHERLLEISFSSVPSEHHEEKYPDFPTLGEAVIPVERYNADVGARTCPACGHVNTPFPLDKWGWGQWTHQRHTVNMAHRALIDFAKDALEEPVAGAAFE
jgi:hypothetical protein